MKYSSVIALLLATSHATKLTQRGVLPPPEAVASALISTVASLDHEVKKNGKDIAAGINHGERSLERELKQNLGLTLPPNTLPKGEDIVQVVGSQLDAGAKDMAAHEKDLVREVGDAMNDLKRTADQMNLGTAKGSQLVDQSLPPADAVVGGIEGTLMSINQTVQDPRFANELQQGIDGFKSELKRAGGDANEKFPSGQQIAGILQGFVGQQAQGFKQNKQEIQGTLNGVRSGLVQAAGDMKLAQVEEEKKEKDPKREKEVADEVEKEVDEVVKEARDHGYKVRIPRNEKEAGEDFKEDLKAFEKEIKDGDFDHEIEELEEFAKKDGRDFDVEEAKKAAEDLIEEEEDELNH